MDKKIWSFVNWGVLVVVVLGVFWMIFGFDGDAVEDNNVSVVSSPGCVDIVSIEEIEYDACYDAASERIFLKMKRGESNYGIIRATVFFVDLSSQSYEFDDIPGAGEEKAYKILAKKNPKNIDVRLDIVQDSSDLICGSRGVFVEYCPTGTSGSGVGVSISAIDGVGITDFVEIEDLVGFDSDIVAMDLVEKEAIWESICKSSWKCDEWEACEGEVERRDCRDLNSCAVPISSPATTRLCDGSCVEDWECEWSTCEDGISTPRCRDLNNCGTSHSIPESLPCEEKGSCSPNVICGEWSECEIDYDFLDLIGVDRIADISGSKTRICVDKKGCVSTQREEKKCSVGVDIYTERFERCGEQYVAVLDVLDDSTLAVLKDGEEGGSYLNIYFDDQDGVRCDYCFDGKMNGDEEGVDCGGSCKSCKVTVYEVGHWWDFLF